MAYQIFLLHLLVLFEDQVVAQFDHFNEIFRILYLTLQIRNVLFKLKSLVYSLLSLILEKLEAGHSVRVEDSLQGILLFYTTNK